MDEAVFEPVVVYIDFSAAVLTGKTLAGLRAASNVGFTIMSEPLDAMKQNDVVTYGLSVARGLSHQVEIVGEVNGRWSTRRGIAPIGTESRGTVKVGERSTHGPWRWNAAAFAGLASVDPTFGLTAGMPYVFRRLRCRRHDIGTRLR